VQRGARFHVRAGLYPVAELPHRSLSPPASPRRIPRAGGTWMCRTRRRGWPISTRTH
jgi:hypothetical protein